jgi:hypothetical protein
MRVEFAEARGRTHAKRGDDVAEVCDGQVWAEPRRGARDRIDENLHRSSTYLT